MLKKCVQYRILRRVHKLQQARVTEGNTHTPQRDLPPARGAPQRPSYGPSRSGATDVLGTTAPPDTRLGRSRSGGSPIDNENLDFLWEILARARGHNYLDGWSQYCHDVLCDISVIEWLGDGARS